MWLDWYVLGSFLSFFPLNKLEKLDFEKPLMGKMCLYSLQNSEGTFCGWSSDCRWEGVSRWLAGVAVFLCHLEFFKGASSVVSLMLPVVSLQYDSIYGPQHSSVYIKQTFICLKIQVPGCNSSTLQSVVSLPKQKKRHTFRPIVLSKWLPFKPLVSFHFSFSLF